MLNVMFAAMGWVCGSLLLAYRMRPVNVLAYAEAESARRKRLGIEPNDVPSMVSLMRQQGCFGFAVLTVMCGFLMWAAISDL